MDGCGGLFIGRPNLFHEFINIPSLKHFIGIYSQAKPGNLDEIGVVNVEKCD